MTRSSLSYTSLRKDDHADDETLTTAASAALIPSGRHPDLSWKDKFFNDNHDDDIIAVFDYDYEKMEEYNGNVACLAYGLSWLYPPVGLLATVFGCAPCYLKSNVSWQARAQHVAVTRDGVRHVTDRHPSWCGLPCSDRGRVSKTVPFDKITDCDVHEPAGNTCGCIPNILYTVNIDTASSGGEKGRELKLAGLKDPYALKRLVWAMKRGAEDSSGSDPLVARTAATMAAMDRGGAESSPSPDVATLLVQIRDELRSNNQLLAEMKANNNNISNQNGAVCETEMSALTEVTGAAEFA